MQLVHRGAEVAAGGTDLQTVDVESLEFHTPNYSPLIPRIITTFKNPC